MENKNRRGYRQDPNEKMQILLRSLRDIVMRVLMVLNGLFFMFHKYINYDFGILSKYIEQNFLIFQMYSYGCLLYGGWRIYRAIFNKY